MLLGVVAFVVALLVSVMLHEAGHFFTARRFGMKATRFFVGFGPTLWSTRRGETEYGVKAIPAGGFVTIVGMTPLEEVPPGDEDRAFYRQAAWKKGIVLAAGSTMHFIIAVLLVFGTTYAVGVVDTEAPVLSAPTACIPERVVLDEPVPEGCTTGTVPGVAAAAGLQSGDRVLSAGGREVSSYVEFVELVRDSPGQPLQLVVERDGDPVSVELVPVPVTRPDLDDPERSVEVGAIGVGRELVTKRLGLVDATQESVDRLGLIVTGTWTALTEKLGTVTKLYSPDRDEQGLVGVVGAARVSGEVLALEVPFAVRVSDFLLLIAGLNLFVGIFNLLPLLPLDGGHLAVVGYESARDKLRRRFAGYRGEIRRVDYNKLLPMTYLVVVAFIGLTLFIAGADIVNPISIN